MILWYAITNIHSLLNEILIQKALCPWHKHGNTLTDIQRINDYKWERSPFDTSAKKYQKGFGKRNKQN